MHVRSDKIINCVWPKCRPERQGRKNMKKLMFCAMILTFGACALRAEDASRNLINCV